MGTHLTAAPLPRSYTPLQSKTFAVPLSEISAETESCSWLSIYDDGQFDDSSSHASSFSDSECDESSQIFSQSQSTTSISSSMASASTAPLPRFTKTAPPLADRVAVLLASPLSSAQEHRSTNARPRTADPDAGSARIAGRVAAALDQLARVTAAATASASLHPMQGIVPTGNNPRESMIPLVVRSLAEHRRDPKVAHSALLTLTQLAASPAFRVKIADVGGIAAVVDVMRIHSLRVEVQSQGCLLLANLTHRTPQNKPLALNSGAIIVVVAAMSIHCVVEEVQAWGCLALRNFTKVNADDVKDPHVAAAAVEVIANAMEKFPKSRTVQIQACVALTNLAALSDIAKTRIGSVAAVRVVVDAVHRNIHSPSATDAALTCLSVLVTDIDNQRKAVLHGVVDALSLALERYSHIPNVVSRASACIRFLSFEIQHRLLLGSGTVIMHLVTALDRHTSQGPPRALREIMHALGNTVAECHPNKETAGRCGAVPAAVRLLSHYTKRDGTSNRNLALVEDACRLLYALLVDCSASHARAAETGLLSAVLDALREHGTQSARVAEHGAAVFVVLARNPEIIHDVRLGSADLASIVRRARAAHAGNRGVARQARDLCDALGLHEQEVQLAWPSGLGDPWADTARPKADILGRLRCRGGDGRCL